VDIRVRWSIVGVLAVSAGACSSSEPPREPPDFTADVPLTKAVDLDPDPHVLEVDLTARESTLEVIPGKPTPVYAYDGKVPGPLLELTAGDRLKVHFKNELPEPTTIHWHGVRVPPDMDGVPDHSQSPVQPGATFDYDFIVPDAGLFWYHPHFDSAKEVGFGLYGALVVRPADASEAAAPPDEAILVLSDIGVNDDGSTTDPKSGGDLGTLFGREGNYTLVNGKHLPTLHVRSGVPQRWRLVNAAKSRYFQLALAGTRFTQIGTDGGLLPKPIETDKLLLVPGQRADVVVTPRGSPNAITFLMWQPYDRGFGSTEFRNPEELVRIRFDDEEEVAGEGGAAPLPSRPVEALDTSGATAVNIQLTQGMDADGNTVLGINDVPFDEAEPFPAFIGETQVWTIENTMQWAHPFHLHGFFFQVLGDDGQPEQPLAWRDTVDIPVYGTRKIAVRYDDRPGLWMFHCHILDHADAGMMGMIDLMRP
jgi:FtsP/CotA-like multicopper oxidase with cupredoxin domain